MHVLRASIENLCPSQCMHMLQDWFRCVQLAGLRGTILLLCLSSCSGLYLTVLRLFQSGQMRTVHCRGYNQLLNCLTQPEFFISLHVAAKVFAVNLGLCRFLQKENIDLVQALNFAHSILSILNDMC